MNALGDLAIEDLKCVLKKKRSKRYRRQKLEEDPEYYKRKRRMLTVEHRIDNPHRTWTQGTISSHKRNGYIVNIETDELQRVAEQTDRCVMCGRLLNWGQGNKKTLHSDSPTLDRINNEKILTMESTQILCLRCNTKKGSMPMKEFVNWCKSIVERYEIIEEQKKYEETQMQEKIRR